MPSTSQAREVFLRVASGQRAGASIRVKGPSFVIGRAEGCQLRPASPEVSRRHAEIVFQDDTIAIRDLGSRNGTTVNGQDVEDLTPLEDGDRIEVGPLALVASIQAPAAVQPSEADQVFTDEVPVMGDTPDHEAEEPEDEEAESEDEYVFESASAPATPQKGGAAASEDASFDDMVASFLSDRSV